MASLHPEERPTLDISEHIARIDKMQAELWKIAVEQTKMLAETLHVQQSTKFEPLQLALGGVAGGAVLFAVAAAFVKLLM